MNKRWWLGWWLVFGACAVPEASIVSPASDVTSEGQVSGTTTQLDEIAALRAAVARAAEAREVLDAVRTPLTGWMTDGAMTLVARDLEARRADLWSRGVSLLVRASLIEDLDPALDALLGKMALE